MLKSTGSRASAAAWMLAFLLFPLSVFSQVAVVVDGPAPAFQSAVAALANEVNAVDETANMPAEATHVGNFTEAKAAELLQAAFADPQVKVVVGVGTLVGLAVAKLEKLPKPVLLPYAAPMLQGLPGKGGVSARTNLSYIGGVLTIERDLMRFNDIVGIDQVIVLADPYIVEALGPLRDARELEFGKVRALIVPAGPSAEDVVKAIPDNATAIYIGPLPRLDAAGMAIVIEGIIARKLPSYAGGTDGRAWVNAGALTTLEPAEDGTRRRRQAALQITDALQGGKPEKFSTVFEARAELAINVATARRIGLSPSFEVLTEAELVGQDDMRLEGRPLSLKDVVAEVVGRNIDLEAERARREATAARLSQAWSTVFPTFQATAGWTWLDPDVASSLGNSEHTLSWGLSAQQIVFSPAIGPAIRARKAELSASDASLSRAELDRVHETMTAYLNVLRAANAEQIHQSNLRTTRDHLALAEVRVEIGSAGRQEVLRWEAQIADDRAKVIQATTARNQAAIELNRLLDRPLEERFVPSDPGVDELGITAVVGRYVRDPWSFERLRAFMVEEALEDSIDLRELNAAITAQEELRVGQTRRLFLPDVALGAGFTHAFYRDGVGSEDAQPPPALALPARDDFVWQVGLSLQFEIFDWTRYDELDETRAVIAELELQRKSARQRIEQRVRSALLQTGASGATMRLSQASADAATANLELVTDGYRTGVLGILTVIDAQNQARVAQLAASDARFDFMLDFINVERALGRFSLLAAPEERKATTERLERFMANQTPR